MGSEGDVSCLRLNTPSIDEDKISVYEPTRVDDLNRVKITIVIPFEGDGKLFQYRPSSFTLNKKSN